VILMLVLLAVSTVAAALVPVEQASRDETSTTSTRTERRDEARGDLVPGEIDAGSRKPKVIRIRLGDQLKLRVASPRSDQVAIPGFGELEDVDPDAPAHFDLLPFETGSYPVRLVDAKRTIGRIEVRRDPAAKSGSRKHSKGDKKSST
jgi:hypothetical protein